MAFWAYIFETAHQILMVFGQMLDTIALNDLTLMLCTKKTSSPLGAFLPPKIKKITTTYEWFFKSCPIWLKICTLSNLMVLNSFLVLFWTKKVVVTPYIKCESLCKQSQKPMKECSHGLRTKATPGNVDMGNSTVPISSLGNVRKCEKTWDPYVNKPKDQWKAHRVDSRWSLPLKVDMGSSMVPFSSSKKCEKCENLM